MVKSELAEKDIRVLNLYQKLAAITGEVGPVAKGGKNTQQDYAYIEYAAVAGALRDLFAKYGVIIVPNMGERNLSPLKDGKGTYTEIKFRFDVINADKPDDRFSVDWIGEASDYGDKGTNKAATAALKYYLMRQFNVSEQGEIEADTHTINDTPAATLAKPTAPARISDDQIKKLYATIGDKGITGDDQKRLVYKMAKVESTKDLSKSNAMALIDKLSRATPEQLQAYLNDRPTPEQYKLMVTTVRNKVSNKFMPTVKVDAILCLVAAVETVADIKADQVATIINDINSVEDSSMLMDLLEPAADDVNQDSEGGASDA